MINLPEDTRVHKRIPKEAFYKHLQLNTSLREKFINDIDIIYVEWTLTTKNLHLSKEEIQDEIVFLLIKLKKKDFDSKLLEVIAKQNPHKIVFVISYKDDIQLAIVHGKIFLTEWHNAKEISLNLNGFSIQEIWNGFIEQIAISNNYVLNQELTTDEKIAKQESIQKLRYLIDKTEIAARKEQQPKKKFELYNILEKYKRKL